MGSVNQPYIYIYLHIYVWRECKSEWLFFFPSLCDFEDKKNNNWSVSEKREAHLVT